MPGSCPSLPDLSACSVVHLSTMAAIGCMKHFFPLLNYVIPEALPSSLVSSASSHRWVCVGGVWHWLHWMSGKLLVAFMRVHPCISLPPKPCPINSIHTIPVFPGKLNQSFQTIHIHTYIHVYFLGTCAHEQVIFPLASRRTKKQISTHLTFFFL